TRSARLNEKADALFAKFNDVFWDEANGFYAYCLDGNKQPVWTVASNPGHLLWSGIVPPDRAARVVERLLAPDMSSGWGIRTLTQDNPTFNPYSYQNGSVWPHDNSLIALGFRKYGFGEQAVRIVRDVAQAASYFTQRQLPELYSGMQRQAASFPVQYLGANVPQAWAAGAVFALVQAMLGIELNAPAGFVELDPTLPDWLPELTLRGLRLGDDRFDIAFARIDGATTFTVLHGDPSRVRRLPDKGSTLAAA
ncbi:MAG: amylo-alpha-1,6-glucosidase, partial [Janthinobacterium lividum]